METVQDRINRIKELNKIADDEKFVPSKEGLDSHHKAANDFWGKHPGITVDDSPEAKAYIKERFGHGETIDDLLPKHEYWTDDPIDLDDYYNWENEQDNKHRTSCDAYDAGGICNC